MIKRKEIKGLKSNLNTVVHSEHTIGFPVIFPPGSTLSYGDTYYAGNIVLLLQWR